MFESIYSFIVECDGVVECISCPVWSSVYECHKVEWVFTCMMISACVSRISSLSSSGLFLSLFMLTCIMIRFLSLFLLVLFDCVVFVVLS